ncbi:MAG: biotin/lipoyl-containing protein [Chloroflexota bacterium]
MTDENRKTTDTAGRATIARLAAETLPRLIERLTRSELSELEVREDGWRIRLRKPSAGNGAMATATAKSTGKRAHAASGAPATGSPSERSSGSARGLHTTHSARVESTKGTVTSPAVGYFVSRDGVAVGIPVSRGDLIGHVDVLGMRQEVVAPIAGVVKTLDVEGGQAIEYGQRIARVEPAESNVQ